MPFRRKFVKRSTAARKRKFRRRTYRKRKTGLSRYVRFNVHAYKRRVLTGSYTTDTLNGTVGGALAFKLSDVPSVSEFTNLYDYYKITGVSVTISWRATNLSAIETVNHALSGVPWMIYWTDRDDASAPTYAQAQEVSRAHRFTFDSGRRTFRTYIKPSILSPAYDTAVSSGYSSEFNKWVDVSNDDVKFYGFKFVIYAPFTTGTPPVYTCDVECVYYLKFKDPR